LKGPSMVAIFAYDDVSRGDLDDHRCKGVD